MRGKENVSGWEGSHVGRDRKAKTKRKNYRKGKIKRQGIRRKRESE